MNSWHRWRWRLVLAMLLALAWGVFQPGLKGVFLLDDYQNLKTLERLEKPVSPQKLASVVFSNPSGDGGRGVAMLTFAAQHASWPGDPAAFKRVNLALHLLNGFLLYCFLNRLFALMRVSAPRRNGLALAATALWMLHPMQVSTVLYVVQRMAELSATFTLLGLLAYLAGRKAVMERPWRGYAVMTFGLGIFGSLAVLSKENGVLLLLYIWVLEFTLLRTLPSPPYWKTWKAAVLGLPLLAVGGYFAVRFSTWILPGYDLRDFTLGERLLTEARVLSDYLGLLLLPHPGAFGLFHDDYALSRSLLDPPWTLAAVALLSALLASAFYVRKRYPVYAFAVLWFFAGHLIESTVIPLELYFEHRNYLPSLGLFFAFAYAVDYLARERFNQRMRGPVIGFLAVWIVLLAAMSWNESRLWGNPVLQAVVWSKAHPDSIRAQLQLAAIKQALGDVRGAEEIYSAISRNEPGVYPSWLALGCLSPDVRLPLGEAAAEALRSARFSKLPFGGMERLVIAKENGTCGNIPAASVLGLFDALLENPNFTSRRHLYLVLKGRWLLADGQWAPALACFDEAYGLLPSVDVALMGASALVLAGQAEKAGRYVRMAREANVAGNRLSRMFYQKDIEQWEMLLHALQRLRP
jgi:tetratricopeptide (TPR) repeat protein